MKGYFEFQYPPAVRVGPSRWRHGTEDGLLPAKAALWEVLKPEQIVDGVPLYDLIARVGTYLYKRAQISSMLSSRRLPSAPRLPVPEPATWFKDTEVAAGLYGLVCLRAKQPPHVEESRNGHLAFTVGLIQDQNFELANRVGRSELAHC